MTPGVSGGGGARKKHRAIDAEKLWLGNFLICCTLVGEDTCAHGSETSEAADSGAE